MKNEEIFKVLLPVVDTLEKLSIPYYIVGSLASSLYGMGRATMDVDIVADVKLHHVAGLKTALESEFYFDDNMVKEAIMNNYSFNLIHLKTALKIDFFILKDTPYENSSLNRRRKDLIDDKLSNKEFYFLAPEDVILSKLQWFEYGKKVSECQWLDVIGIIKVKENSLDKEYLKKWAIKLGLFDLLKKAFEECGIKL